MDDSLIEGMDKGLLSRLDTIYKNYDEIINGTAQSHTDIIEGVLEKVAFKGVKEQLIQLCYNTYVANIDWNDNRSNVLAL